MKSVTFFGALFSLVSGSVGLLSGRQGNGTTALDVRSIIGTWYMVGLDREIFQSAYKASQMYNYTCGCPTMVISQIRNTDFTFKTTCAMRWTQYPQFQSVNMTSVAVLQPLSKNVSNDSPVFSFDMVVSPPMLEVASNVLDAVQAVPNPFRDWLKASNTNRSWIILPNMYPTHGKMDMTLFSSANNTRYDLLYMDASNYSLYYNNTNNEVNSMDMRALLSKTVNVSDSAFNTTTAKLRKQTPPRDIIKVSTSCTPV
ncbi:uncharacterized protein BYT42DRAFT_549693 [Radiomyces spectabilis]|uniref:uncharacterized protein n=1 Tax=Radiomyces spectabilis TaxID=64574 RepID=UPI00221E9CCD|nr:uncharacterized protein BYT42DRAFT_549693 [Radiomyces spectabilis]KAI8367690.1 hypothetical protein BYT42DRAFT_549693 [Radiomyces spectabilis]